MKHVKFILVTLLTVVFFSSCNDSDEDMDVETAVQLEITQKATLDIINTSDNERKLIASIRITGDPKWMYGKINNNGGEYNLTKSGDIYSMEIPIEERDFPGVVEFSVTITIDDPRADSLDNEKLTTEVKEIIWIESIHITGIEQVNFTGTTLVAKTLVEDNSLNQGKLKSTLFKDGAELDSAVLTFVGAETPSQGEYSHSNIVGNHTYQILYENIDPSDPTYVFIGTNGKVIKDANGKAVTSVVLEFTITSSVVTISVQGIDFTNDTDTSFISTLDATINTAGEKIWTRVYADPNSNTHVYEREHTSTEGVQEIVDGISDLTGDIEYTIRYFHGDSTDHFFESKHSTLPANAGIVDVEIEDLSATVNNIILKMEYDNTTSTDVEAEVRFTGRLLSTGEIDTIYFYPNLVVGMTDTDITLSSDVFMQYSDADVSIYIDNVLQVNQTITTNTIEYSDTQFMVINDTLISGNGNSVEIGTAQTEANGFGNFKSFKFSIVMPAGVRPENYIDNIKIGLSNLIDLEWTETSTGSGVWIGLINYTESIAAANYYTIWMKPENFTTIGGAGVDDVFDLTISGVDDVNTEVVFGTIPITFKN